MGKDFGENGQNSDRGIFKVGEFFETKEQRDAIGLIAIHVDGLSISGCGVFIEYITQRMTGKFEVDSYGGKWVYLHGNGNFKSK